MWVSISFFTAVDDAVVEFNDIKRVKVLDCNAGLSSWCDPQILSPSGNFSSHHHHLNSGVPCMKCQTTETYHILPAKIQHTAFIHQNNLIVMNYQWNVKEKLKGCYNPEWS